MSTHKSNTPNRDLVACRFLSGTCFFFEVFTLVFIAYTVFLAFQNRPNFDYSQATFWVVFCAISHNFIGGYRKSVDEDIRGLYEQLAEEAETAVLAEVKEILK